MQEAYLSATFPLVWTVGGAHAQQAANRFRQHPMSLHALTPDFAVAGQITPEDVPAIAQAGFRSIVCNRPDGEGGPMQPSYADVERAAKAAGLEVRNLPVISGRITPEQVGAMAELLEELPAPVLAYCRSGARSTNLWQMARAHSKQR